MYVINTNNISDYKLICNQIKQNQLKVLKYKNKLTCFSNPREILRSPLNSVQHVTISGRFRKLMNAAQQSCCKSKIYSTN